MYSVQIETSDGTLTRVNLGIEYFEKGDITVYRNDAETPLVLGTDWQWGGDRTIVLLKGAEPAGNKILVYRNTDKERAFNIYDGGAPFSRDTLDENFKQLIYLAQEFTEGSGIAGLYRNLNMHGNRVINMGGPVDPTDAATKQYVDALDANQGQWIQAVDTKHTLWNQKQDADIAGLKIGVVDGTSHRTVPFLYRAVGGETLINTGYNFKSALVSLNGVEQYQLDGAFSIEGTGSIRMAKPLFQGDMVQILIGSRPAAPSDDLIIASPNGKHWRVLVSDTGVLSTEAVNE